MGRSRLLYARHYASIVLAMWPAVGPLSSTRAARSRPRVRAIAALAAARGRPAHLVMIDAPRDEAEAGQRARGRTVPAAEMDHQDSPAGGG